MEQARARRGRPKGEGSQLIYSSLRQRIVHMEWGPGRNIDEMSLVKEFGGSRTPVREALIRLAAEDLVTILPNQGAQVAAIDLHEVREFFEFFDLCQRAATRWAALRHHPDQLAAIRRHCREFRSAAMREDISAQCETNAALHGAIAECCGNDYLKQTYLGLLTKNMRLAHMSVSHVLKLRREKITLYDRMFDEHDALVELIAVRDADGAETLAHTHAEHFLEAVIDVIEHSDAPGVRIALSEGLDS